MRRWTVALWLVAAAACADEPATDRGSMAPPAEIEVRDALHREGASLLRAGDYADADRIISRYRSTHARTPAGDSRLRLLYEGIENPGLVPQDPQWPAIEGRTSDWISTHPDSPTAVILAAAALLAHAEAWRAGRYIPAMAPDEQAAMRALLTRARDLLDAWPGMAAQAPEWTWVRLHVARALGEEPAARLQFALGGLRATPDDDAVHDAAIGALAQKWGGDARLQRRYIDAALRRVHGGAGDQLPARLYSLVLRSAQSLSTLRDELRRSGATWPALQSSFDALLHSSPEPWKEPWNLALYRSFACVYEDRERYLALNAQLGDDAPAVAALDTPGWRAACRAWAEGRIGSAMPQAVAPTENAAGVWTHPASLVLGLIALLAIPALFRLWRWQRSARRTR